MKFKKLLCTVLATATLLTCAAGVASATTTKTVNDTGIAVNQGIIPPTADQIRRGEEKAADMSRLVQLLGLGDASSVGAASRNSSTMKQYEQAEAAAIMAKYSSVVNPNSVLASSKVTRAIPTTKTLAFTTVMQSNSYYCGPASAYMVLKYEGKSVTQSGLASRLNTTTNGTDFGGSWEAAMNYYSDHTYAVLWGDGNDTLSRAILLADSAIGTLASGYGVIYDTVQPSGTSTKRLTGYPAYMSSTVYHYVAGRGYSAVDPSNRIGYYTDPTNSTTYSNGYGAKSIALRMMCTLVTTRGIVF